MLTQFVQNLIPYVLVKISCIYIYTSLSGMSRTKYEELLPETNTDSVENGWKAYNCECFFFLVPRAASQCDADLCFKRLVLHHGGSSAYGLYTTLIAYHHTVCIYTVKSESKKTSNWFSPEFKQTINVLISNNVFTSFVLQAPLS